MDLKLGKSGLGAQKAESFILEFTTKLMCGITSYTQVGHRGMLDTYIKISCIFCKNVENWFKKAGNRELESAMGWLYLYY